MEIIAAELEAENIRFALIYKKIDTASRTEKTKIKGAYAKYFPGREIIMMYAENDKLPHYFGKKKLIEWLLVNYDCPEFKKYVFQEA